MNKKIKNWGKTALLISALVAGVSILGASLGYKYSTNFKPSFYNYRSYMSKRNIAELSKTFEYKQFNEISEFNTALISNRAVAGIGSDFQAVTLIKKGKLKKIDYAKLFGIPNLKPQDYAEALKTILRPTIWEHLNAYNDDLKTDEFGNAYDKPKHLWEYFMPYYSQDAVIAYNILKNPIKKENLKNSETGELNFEKYRRPDFNPYQMVNIMKILKENGFNNWVITDAMRDNLLYGSGYSVNLRTEKRDDSQFTGRVFPETYKTLVDNFTTLIKDGTGFTVNDTNHINFKGDGLELLNDLINPNTKVNVALMYNGDAIDAYYSKDNFDTVDDGTAIRIIRPIKNILLLDGFVISSSNDEHNAEKYSKVVGESVFQNSSLAYKFRLEDPNLTIKQANTKALDKYYLDFKTNEINDMLAEFGSKNTFQQINDYLRNLLNDIDKKRLSTKADNETERVNIDSKIVKEIFKSKVTKFLNELSGSQISKEALVNFANNDIEKAIISIAILQIVGDNEKFNEESNEEKEEQITSQVSNILSWVSMSNDDDNPKWKTELFSQKYLNIDNYDFINYTPSIYLDYSFIERNYFYNDDGTVDKLAIDIFRIDNGTNNIEHMNISPIGDSLLSNVAFYYFQKTKS